MKEIEDLRSPDTPAIFDPRVMMTMVFITLGTSIVAFFGERFLSGLAFLIFSFALALQVTHLRQRKINKYLLEELDRLKEQIEKED